MYIISEIDTDEAGPTPEHESNGAHGHTGGSTSQLHATENDDFPSGSEWDVRGTANTHAVSMYLHTAFRDMVPWFQEPKKLTVRPPMCVLEVLGIRPLETTTSGMAPKLCDTFCAIHCSVNDEVHVRVKRVYVCPRLGNETEEKGE